MPRVERLLTDQEYTERLIAQDGRCAICRAEPPPDRRLAIDHDHTTQRVRGLLCTRCNMGLGFFRDRPDLIDRALDYLGGMLATDPVVGLPFVSWDDGAVQNQGWIVGKVRAGAYLVELFSWWDGEPNGRHVWHSEKIDALTFFPTFDAMRSWNDERIEREHRTLEVIR